MCRRDIPLVDTVCLELTVRDAGEKSKGLSEHRSIETWVVFREERFELPSVVAGW
jgi:hypothetical protein